MNSLIANEKGRTYQSSEQIDRTPSRISEQAYKQAEEMLNGLKEVLYMVIKKP